MLRCMCEHEYVFVSVCLCVYKHICIGCVYVCVSVYVRVYVFDGNKEVQGGGDHLLSSLVSPYSWLPAPLSSGTYRRPEPLGKKSLI